MKDVKGNKVYKDDANIMLVQGCHDGKLEKVVQAVELYKADLDATDALGYARALIHALRACGPDSTTGDTIVQYLVSRGADVNFKHGDKYSNGESRPYFVYWAVTNSFVHDDTIMCIIEHADKETLTYKPTTQIGANMYSKSALEEIKQSRPKLYKKLVEKRIVKPTTR